MQHSSAAAVRRLPAFQAMPPDGCPALVLNADFRPLSYFPLSLWSWQDTLKAVFLDRVDVVAEYETQVHSPTRAMRLPSVVSLKTYVNHARQPAFTRFNVFLRDGFACQYCGTAERENLTFDHVIPRNKGGKTTWENIVAACSPCNLKKGGKMPRDAKMFPHHAPRRPNMFELNERGRAFPPNYLHESWQDYLYWDVELEP
ncbi:5-methylcytosine-specific restriction endonuclease McrA [Parvularcula dongshanensis]|uniref:5-methylcytosine-specific restriction endonuclease McrA n=2 Tax=Parvularcula dongshanensis TaxID=1173995 RepID=A0A840I402_9PROT|nr:5-methylcytosine-specific restriction endonuclease McrA [Parvularcula dongshanensis]